MRKPYIVRIVYTTKTIYMPSDVLSKEVLLLLVEERLFFGARKIPRLEKYAYGAETEGITEAVAERDSCIQRLCGMVSRTEVPLDNTSLEI